MRTASNTSASALKKNRKLKVFLFFLILTTIIWMLVELSKTYNSYVYLKVSYTNIPENKLLQSEPLSEIKAAVRAPGFNLLKLKLRKAKVKIDLNNLIVTGNSHYILTNRLASGLSTQITGENDILSLDRDTVFFDFGNKIFKKVPVIPKVDIQFNLGYNLTDELNIIPDSVLVSGPQRYVDSITEILTEHLELNDVANHIEEELLLNTGGLEEFITLSDNKVRVIGKVDKFTEGSFYLPVIIVNEPEGLKMNPFPKEIEVVYQAGLSNFGKISKNNFTIVYDYNQYAADTLIKFLTPIVRQKSEFVSGMKIHPNEIEFLIQNKPTE